MGSAITKIEKVKSLNKRIELVDTIYNQIESDEIPSIVNLLIEKAKNSREICDVIACVGRLEWVGRKKFIIENAARVIEHPTQSGSVIYIMNSLGIKDELIEYWISMVESPDYDHPNLKAQMISWGLLFDHTKDMAQKMLSEHLKKNPDVPDICYKKPDPSNSLCLKNWI